MAARSALVSLATDVAYVGHLSESRAAALGLDPALLAEAVTAGLLVAVPRLGGWVASNRLSRRTLGSAYRR